MAFPSDLKLVTLNGKVDGWPDGGADGTATVSNSRWLVGGAGDGNSILKPVTATEELATDGTFTMVLPATNDPDWIPQDWTYDLHIVSDGKFLKATFQLDWEQDEVDLADVINLDNTVEVGALYVRLNQIGNPNGVASLDEEGVVPDEQLPPVAYSDLVGKPATFPHDPITYAELTGKPTTFPAADVVDSTFTIRKGDNSAGLRFRSTGGAVDIDLMNGDVVLSSFAGPGFAGAQTGLLRFKGGGVGVTLAGLTEFGDSPYGGQQSIDSRTGKFFATLGGKNGADKLNICGMWTTAAAPTTGTWAKGDVLIGTTGVWHLCTVAGTPGTWT